MVLWNRKPNPENVTMPDKETQIRSMGGNSGDIATSVASAPDSTDTATPTSTSAVSRGRRKAQQNQPTSPIVSPQTIAELEQLAKRKAALQRMSEMMLEDMAGAPYEFWAAVVDDDDIKLSKDEAEELGEAYRIVAECLPMGNMPTWVTLPLFILGRNARLVRKRMKLMQENQEKKLVEAAEERKRPS